MDFLRNATELHRPDGGLMEDSVDEDAGESQRGHSAPQSSESSGHVPPCLSPSGVKAFLRRHALIILTVAAVGIGCGLGGALRFSNMTARDVKYFSFPGELLMRMLQMLVLPLIISSVITGMSSLTSNTFGKIGFLGISYYLLTMATASLTGVTVVVLIQPGTSTEEASMSSGGDAEHVHSADAFLDLIRNMFPSNLVEACFQQYKTVYSTSASTTNLLGVVNLTETNGSATSPTPDNITGTRVVDDMVPKPGTTHGTNTLGVMVFSISLGLSLGRMGTKGKPLLEVFECLNEAVLRLINIVIWYSPMGILFLIGGQIVGMDMEETGHRLGMYILSVITGLVVHSFFTLPLFYFIVTRKNPYRYMVGLLQALLTAFGTSSSIATLPMSFYCVEEIHNMDKRVTRFMLPVGATMGMDGTALYEAVAAIYIAQVHNIELNVGQLFMVSITAIAASMGVAGVPQAGLITIVIVLTSVGLPTDNIALLLTVDWLLDRLRTVSNVLTDCIGVPIVQHLSRHELQHSAPAEERTADSMDMKHGS